MLVVVLDVASFGIRLVMVILSHDDNELVCLLLTQMSPYDQCSVYMFHFFVTSISELHI